MQKRQETFKPLPFRLQKSKIRSNKRLKGATKTAHAVKHARRHINVEISAAVLHNFKSSFPKKLNP